jgi:primosomal protein N' (replication factor Y)
MEAVALRAGVAGAAPAPGAVAEVVLDVPLEAAVLGSERAATPELRGPEERWAEPWTPYQGGRALLRRLAAGQAPRAVWSALPARGAHDWPAALAAAAGATLTSGRGSVVVVPDVRDVDRVCAALDAAGLGHVRLVAELGAAARYRAFLRALLGDARRGVGTRAAAFAPVRDLGLVVCWDDGDDLLREPRAPYPHALEVLRIRAELEGAAAIVGGHARSTAAQVLLEDGWARAVAAERAVVRRRAPRILAPDESDLARDGAAGAARVPHVAWALAREALRSGPVLVQVPRAGYVPVTACATCRTPARCRTCAGSLRLGAPGSLPECSWCGRPAAAWVCGSCGGRVLRATRVGSARTAEELGRAFPGVAVVVSGGEHGAVRDVDGGARLVVATPGAEPRAPEGYEAALLLDAAVTSGRPELGASEEALRRWLNAAALVKGADEGGRVMVLGRGAPIPVQALVRWDPGGFAARELAERAELAFPPAWVLASLDGPADAVDSFLAHLALPSGAEVLGPVPAPMSRPSPVRGEVERARVDPGPVGSGPVGSGPVEPDPPAAVGGRAAHARGVGRHGAGDPEAAARALVRAPRSGTGALAVALAQAAAARSARKEPGSVRVQVDARSLW